MTYTTSGDIIAPVEQRFHGSAWQAPPSRLIAPPPVDDLLRRIRERSLVPVVAITIVDDCPNTSTFNHYGAFKRDGATHETHVDVASVPTSTSLAPTFDLIIRQALAMDHTKLRPDGDRLTFLPDVWLSSDHPELRSMAAASVINALLARKLGLAGALARRELVYSFGPFSISIEEINHPLGPDGSFDNERVEAPSGYGREEAAMMQLRVGVIREFNNWPERTEFFGEVQFGPESDFIAMIDERDAQRMFREGALGCSLGSCVRTARGLIFSVERSGGRKPVSASNAVVINAPPAHGALCLDVATSVRSLIEKGPQAGPVPYARVDATGTARYDLGELHDHTRRTLVVCPVDLADPDPMQFGSDQVVTVLVGTVARRLWRQAPTGVNVARVLNEIGGNEICQRLVFDSSNRLCSDDPVLLGLSWSPDKTPGEATRHLQGGQETVLKMGEIVQLIPRFVPTSPFVAYLCDGPALPERIYSDDPVDRVRNGRHPYGRPLDAGEAAAQMGKFLGLLAVQYPLIDATFARPVAPVTLR